MRRSPQSGHHSFWGAICIGQWPADRLVQKSLAGRCDNDARCLSPLVGVSVNMKTADLSVRHAATYLAKGMAVTMLLVGLKLFVESTSLGTWAELQTRSFLLGLLPNFREHGADAIVVDISQFAGGEPNLASGRLEVTSREKLRELISRLSALSPLAIGVDVDFSTQGSDWLDPGDPKFFDFCLDVNTRVPIRLGVWRSIPNGRGNWLGTPEYSQLAAALFVTDSGSGRLPIWVSSDGSGPRLLTLGASLAAAANTMSLDPYSLAGKSGALKSAVFDQTVNREIALKPSSVTVQTQEAPVNYSVMRQLTREYIPKSEPGDLVKYASRIQGRIVVLGAVDKTGDLFDVPGDRTNRPGVFLHAAQAHTLTSEPVYEFGHGFRILVDFLVSFMLLATVVAWRWMSSRGMLRDARVSESRVVAVGCGLVALGGVFLMVKYRVFWLDFILVAVFLVLHKPMEHALLGEHGNAHGQSHDQSRQP